MIALAKEPQARFKSIKAFTTAFMQASTSQEPELTIAKLEENVKRTRKRPSRRTFTIGLLGGLVVSGALVWKPLTYKVQSLITVASTPPHLNNPVLAPGTLRCTYHGHSSSRGGTAISWSNDSRRIASASDNIQIWDATTGKLDRIYRFGPYNSASINALAWSPDNKYIAASIALQTDNEGSDDGIYVLDSDTGKTVRQFHQSEGSSNTNLAWSHNGQLIASVDYIANTVQVWNALSGTQLITYHGHTSPINSLTWSPDGTWIASSDGKGFDPGNDTGAVHIWGVATGQTRMIYHGHPDPVIAVVWSPDGQHIASAGSPDDGSQTKNPNSNTVQLWKPDSDKPLLIYRQHIGHIKAVAWSPNSKYIVSGSENANNHSNTAQALVWDATSGQTRLAYQGHNHQAFDGVTAVIWSPDGKLIASAGFDATIQVWTAI